METRTIRILLTSFAALTLTLGLSAQSTWFVDPNGSDGNAGTSAGPANAFRTINHANSVAATGDVIRLSAGTFADEQGIVLLGDKSLTIVGQGAGTTTIRAHSTLTTNVNTGFVATPVATQQRPIVLVEGGGRVDFRGITFDGNFAMPGNGRLVGLYYRNGADGLVEDCEIENCRAEPLSGAQGCAAVIVRGDDLADSCDVLLRNCFVHDFGKAGVVSFFNTNLEVENTRVVGAGPVGLGSPAQNGIQISFDSSGVVRNSTITDIYYTESSAAGTGILAYDADLGVRIEDNGIGACELGISAIALTHSTVPVVVRRNRVHCTAHAIELQGVTSAQIEDNQFHSADSTTIAVAFDDAINSWVGNSYSTYIGVGAHPIGGAGGAQDLSPRNTVDMVGGAPITTALPSGHAPFGMLVANFDGSGADDFATLDQNAGLSVSIGLNTGGGFSVTNVPLPSLSAAPVAIVRGNFEPTPGVDIAVLTTNIFPATTQNIVYILRNVGGTGVFTLHTVQTLTGIGTAKGLASGNLDGDADTDLVVTGGDATNQGIALLLRNDGTGVFTQTTLAGPAPKPFTGATVAHLDVDLYPDIALTEGDVTVGRLHLLAGSSASTFAAMPGSPLAIGNDPRAIVDSDFDGDVDFDLLIAEGAVANGAVEVFENDGFGGFAVHSCFVDRSATGIAVGNLDSDSLPDGQRFGDAAIVNFNGGSVTVLGDYRKGAGFGAGGIAARGGAPSGVAFGNFNGDSDQDLFYCDAVNGTVVVLPGVAQARTAWYGYGVPGERQRIPHLRPSGNAGPTQPNATFGLFASNTRPSSLVAIVACSGTPPLLTPGQPQIDLGTQLFAFLLLSDSSGAGGAPVPLPATPSIFGVKIVCEAAVFDPAAALIAGVPVALSRGLELRIGD